MPHRSRYFAQADSIDGDLIVAQIQGTGGAVHARISRSCTPQFRYFIRPYFLHRRRFAVAQSHGRLWAGFVNHVATIGRHQAWANFGFVCVRGPIQANCWPTLQQGPDPRFACADGGRGMAQRAALIEGFRPFGWCLCLFLQLSAKNQQLSYLYSPRCLFFFSRFVRPVSSRASLLLADRLAH